MSGRLTTIDLNRAVVEGSPPLRLARVQKITADGDEVVRVKALDPRPGYANVWMKDIHTPAGFRQDDRILHPLLPRLAAGEWEL